MRASPRITYFLAARQPGIAPARKVARTPCLYIAAQELSQSLTKGRTMHGLRNSLLALALLAGAAPAFAFEISSSSVSDGKWANKYVADKIAGCGGGNVSPALTWKDAPAGTKSFALTLFDPDAPSGSGFWHWQVWNIPANVSGFKEGKVPSAAVQGKGDIGRTGYLGPCPPPGTGAHHYKFTLYAMSVDKLGLNPDTASVASISDALNAKAIAKATAVYAGQ
jgi:Raf kinase inhibitor-like YbhB/YbcL family protein